MTTTFPTQLSVRYPRHRKWPSCSWLPAHRSRSVRQMGERVRSGGPGFPVFLSLTKNRGCPSKRRRRANTVAHGIAVGTVDVRSERRRPGSPDCAGFAQAGVGRRDTCPTPTPTIPFMLCSSLCSVLQGCGRAKVAPPIPMIFGLLFAFYVCFQVLGASLCGRLLSV